MGKNGKESTYNAEDSTRGLRSPGEENSYLLPILALEILWIEEPGRLWSTGSQRVGHDVVTK